MKKGILIVVIAIILLFAACVADQAGTIQEEIAIQETEKPTQQPTASPTWEPTPKPTDIPKPGSWPEADNIEQEDYEIVEGIDVYVNDEFMDVTVYKNEKYDHSDNWSDFVLAQPILDFLDIELILDKENDLLVLKSEKYGETKWKYSTDVKIIDNHVYIIFSQFRYHTDGSLKQDDDSAMYLFTGDYERTDLPTTLEECYAMMDEILSEEDIDYMKNCTDEDRIMMHFGFGMWIRNEWLYPTQSKLTELIYGTQPMHIDDISAIIIEGYYRYLNDEPCTLEDMIDWYNEEYAD